MNQFSMMNTKQERSGCFLNKGTSTSKKKMQLTEARTQTPLVQRPRTADKRPSAFLFTLSHNEKLQPQ